MAARRRGIARSVNFTIAVGTALALGTASQASAAPASQGCNQDPYGSTGRGANHSGPYDDTCTGSPSGNGNGKGVSKGKPCAGCVGKADEKNPQGQYPNGSDRNAGYECDRNHGIGRTNPAHTGCRSGVSAPPNSPPPRTNNPPRTDTPPPRVIVTPPIGGTTTTTGTMGTTMSPIATRVLGTMFTLASGLTSPLAIEGSGIEGLAATGLPLLPFAILGMILLGLGLVLRMRPPTARRSR